MPSSHLYILAPGWTELNKWNHVTSANEEGCGDHGEFLGYASEVDHNRDGGHLTLRAKRRSSLNERGRVQQGPITILYSHTFNLQPYRRWVSSAHAY